jgi:HAE1 family hydrophobic/amphiphilic exporter-1
MIGSFIAGVVRRPVTTAMLTIALLLFGLVAASRMPVDLLPDLAYPSITVRTTYPDAAPVEVEDLVTRPVEELVGAVPGLVRVESVSREGQSEVVLEFAWGTPIDRAMADVREKLDRVRLPNEAERPQVLRYDPSQSPILRLALVSDSEVDLAKLRFVAERQVERELEKSPGVAAVVIHGGDDEEVRVELQPGRLAAFGVTGQEVVDAIVRDNVNRPGGGITESDNRYLVRTVHEAKTPEELQAIVVRSSGPAALRVGDLATVEITPLERTESSFVGTRRAVELSVFREGDANTVAVARGVTGAIPGLKLPEGMRVEVLSDQALFIEAAVNEVREAAGIGAILAIAVLLFFLWDLRATLVIALAIPISVLMAFIPLRSLGVNVNLMSLGGIALGIGMLVDNSIVVLEAIARRAESGVDEGLSRAQIAVAGASEVAGAVIASTLTTVAVFLPMAFVQGVAGALVRDLSLAVSFSILSSMVVSLTVVPAISGMKRGEGGTDGQGEGSPYRRDEDGASPPMRGFAFSPLRLLSALFGLVWKLLTFIALGLAALVRPLWKAYEALESLYPPLLRGALRLRALVLVGGLGLVAASLFFGAQLSRTLLPEIERDAFFVQLTLPQGSSLLRTERSLLTLTRSVEDHEGVELLFARAGSVSQSGSAAGSVEGTHLGQLDLQLDKELSREARTQLREELVDRLREVALPEGTRFVVGEPALIAFDPPIEVQVFADDPARAAIIARELVPKLAAIEGLEDPAADDLLGRPEVELSFDRERLAQFALSVDAVATAVQLAIQGSLAGKMHTDEDQLDIRVQLPRVDRSQVDDVEQVQVGVSQGIALTLANVAKVEGTVGPAEIRRLDGRRGLRITAHLSSTDLDEVATAVEAALPSPNSDRGEEVRLGGQASELGDSLLGLAFTAALSIFLVYVVMASSFESLHHPFLIIFTVPLALVGVVAACMVARLPISALVGIGTIILGGIVVNNAIVLINAVNQRRGQGMSVEAALIDAGKLRLRPILMTTLTTSLGLLPMAFGFGEGAALRQPLAVSVIGGLSVATLLTLLVIPCAYSLVPGRRRAAWAPSTSEADARAS